jgi:hypothetical protein
MNFIDEQRNADMLDALADIAHEQEQAMRESAWDGIDEILWNAMLVITQRTLRNRSYD